MTITLAQYLGSFAHEGEPPQDITDNATELLARVNALLAKIDLPEAQEPHVNSGWRPAWYNATVANAAPKSKHITGQAIDIADPDGALDQYLTDYRTLLVDHDLYQEHPASTKGWCHLQSVPPRSGNRVFYP